jgi:acyl carrier protein
MSVPDTTPDITTLLPVIRELVGEVHPHWKNLHFSPDTHLEKELGLDSMARLELCTRVESSLGITLDENAVAGATTPNKLLQVILDHHRNGTRDGDTASDRHGPDEVLMGSFGPAEETGAAATQRSPGAWLYALYSWSVFIIVGLLTWVVVVLAPLESWRRKLAHLCGRLFFLLTFTPFRIMPLRMLLQRFGVEFVDRFNGHKGASDVRRITRKAQGGQTIVFFPEGTFTTFPGLQPFRMGAFVTASRAGIPVIPVAISGAREMVRGSDWFPHRGRISVTIRPPITPSGEGWQVALNLRNAARTEIARYCGEPDLVEGEQIEDT